MNSITNTRKIEGAYPGDTYLEDCSRAASSKPSWAGALLVGASLAALVDLYNIHDLFAKTSDAAGTDVFTWAVTIGIVAVYVFVGFGIGNPLRSFCAFGGKSELAIAAGAGVVELAVVCAVSYFRYGTEAALAAQKAVVTAASASAATSSQIASAPAATVAADPIAMTALYTFIMAAGALMSIVYAYKSRNALAERILGEAAAELAHDSQVYSQAFQDVMCNADEESASESSERDLDARIAEATSRINMLAAEAAMVLDPADAYDIAQSSRMVTSACFSESANAPDGKISSSRMLPIDVLFKGNEGNSSSASA